jgi:ATP-dependent DNA helicase RecG
MYVRGVGPRVAEILAAKSIQTAEDLLYHLPFRYEDRQNPRSLDELKPAEMASVIAEVRGSVLLRTRKMPIFELTVGQGRHALKCIWFHARYLEGKFHAGQTVAIYGKVEPSGIRDGQIGSGGQPVGAVIAGVWIAPWGTGCLP